MGWDAKLITEEKIRLEKRIAEQIDEFEKKTDAVVNEIEFIHYRIIDSTTYGCEKSHVINPPLIKLKVIIP